MAAVDRIPGGHPIAPPPAAQQSPKGTVEKIRQFFSRFEGIGTIFSILAGTAVAVLWGVQFGLMAAATGMLLTVAVSSCRSKGVAPPPVLYRNPPAPDIRARLTAEGNHLLNLGLPFHDVIALQTALIVDFRQMDLCQVQLESVEPIRFDHVYRPMGTFIVSILRYDGYRISLQTPRGPATYYVDRAGAHVAHFNEVLVIP